MATAKSLALSFEGDWIDTRRYRVLLVEDHPGEAELVVESLSASTFGGFDITHVATLKEACAACERAKYDCIVLDLQLPDSSGVETIRAMRERSPDAAIVAYSGLEDERARAAALREGAQDFVSKNGPESEALNRGILFAVERWRAIKLHRQFEGLFAANPDAMVILDAEGIVQFANTAAFDLLDRDASLIGDRLSFVVRQGEVGLVNLMRGSERRACEVRAFPCMWDGEPALLAALRDVTQRNELEEKLRKAQELQAIGRFAGGLAHDFGNVLSCIEVFADLTRNPNRTALKPEYLDGIAQSVQRGRGIVRQLISLEQGSKGDPERVDVGSMLGDLESFLRMTLPNEIACTISIEEGLWPVIIDRGQLEQVVLNLILNARDAMPEGGTLSIRCANVAGEIRKPDRVMLVVSDTGPGVPAEHRDRIFDLFFTTKAPGRGTGLGLAMCQTIIEQMGGSIELLEKEGETGASFAVMLPRAQFAQARGRKAAV